MIRHSIKHAILALALIGSVAAAAVQAAPTAHAASQPSIMAVSDAVSAGVLSVAGQGFTPRSTATVQVLTAGGTLLASVTARVNSEGAFAKIFFFAVACASQLAQPVTVRAVDASQAMSNSYPVAMSGTLAAAQAQLAAATSALTTLLHSANPSSQQVAALEAAIVADYTLVVAAQSAGC